MSVLSSDLRCSISSVNFLVSSILSTLNVASKDFSLVVYSSFGYMLSSAVFSLSNQSQLLLEFIDFSL